MLKPREYGYGVGPTKPLAPIRFEISLRDSGVDLSAAGKHIDRGGAVEAVDVRLDRGGVLPAYAVAAFGASYAGVNDKNVIHIAPYEIDTNNRLLMRLRVGEWDRWNGLNWATLTGGNTGTINDRWYTTMQNGWFIGANGIDKLKYWDGNDAHNVQDLSADSPAAKYVARLGTRLVAANIRIAGTQYQNRIARSADGNIQDWTTALAGAGAGDLIPEGSNDTPNNITGLSTLVRGLAVYRQRSIVIGTLTGNASAPIRYSTVDFSHGTESPYSIASGGMVTGDFFMGHDYMVYNFDGNGDPKPIGLPILPFLQDTIADLTLVVGAVDTNAQEYWLTYATAEGTTLQAAWVFSIKEWVQRGRLVWRRGTLPANTNTFGYGPSSAVNDPIVDTVGSIVDTVGTRVDTFGRAFGPKRIMFGDTTGTVWQLDYNTPRTTGYFRTGQVFFDGYNATVDFITLLYSSTNGGTVAVAISTDGGATWQDEKTYTLGITDSAQLTVTRNHRVTGKCIQIRLRPLSGFFTIHEISGWASPLGRA